MYKGYKVVEEIIKDYEYPQIEFVLRAPCGCQACKDEVQPGHFACSRTPAKLQEDENISATLEGGRWYWRYFGPEENVDSFLAADL